MKNKRVILEVERQDDVGSYIKIGGGQAMFGVMIRQVRIMAHRGRQDHYIIFLQRQFPRL